MFDDFSQPEMPLFFNDQTSDWIITPKLQKCSFYLDSK